ncbi:hypothetical protein J2S74_000217 [Evansella vedderi]|uniref:Uncharacterized protein n=1 Tax=Evansella vedderi TaxID=38282 RepID=A0ABT9ZPG9_9BACI|nr:hypothetical protein [Evansella vedderi]MDQ0252845.1 hypothetical protein [Evansella vedderi]
MYLLLGILSSLFIVVTIIGLFQPNWVFPWGERTRKQALFTYLPLTLMTLILFGMIGKAEAEIDMEAKIRHLQGESLQGIELTLEQLDTNFAYYEETSKLLNDQFDWLRETVLPYYETVEGIVDITDYTRHLNKFQWLQSIHEASQFGNFTSTIGISSRILSATLGEVAIHMRNLNTFTDLDEEISTSISKLKALHEEYKETKELDVLVQIDRELNTTYFPLIKELESFIQESIITFHTLATFFYQQQNIKMFASDALDAFMFWKEQEDDIDADQRLTELAENLALIENAPEEFRSRIQLDTESIMSIHSHLAVIQALEELNH